MLIKNSGLRWVIFILGILSLVLGFIGAFLPLLPTTPFVLLAAWCFVKSSPKAHMWIYAHPILGPPLKDWERNKSISRRTKMVAITMIVVSAVVIWFRVPNPPVGYSVISGLAVVAIFIGTRRSS